MRHIALLLLILAATPLRAESLPDLGLPEGLIPDDLKNQFQELLDKIPPELQSLADKLDNLSLYEFPETLPNGDIIIRRKHPLEMTPGPDETIDI